jgi:uncharacterized RDD family membrane protein YckC
MASTTPQAADVKFRPARVRSHRPAGFFSRTEAFVLDLIILGIIELIGTAFIQYFLYIFRFLWFVKAFKTWLQNANNNLNVSAVLIALFVIAYFTFCWALVGFTPGKAAVGLKVVRTNGKKLSFGRSLLRFIAYWISAIPLFLGFFWILWDSKRQGWHDKIAGTQVVYLPRKPHK